MAAPRPVPNRRRGGYAGHFGGAAGRAGGRAKAAGVAAYRPPAVIAGFRFDKAARATVWGPRFHDTARRATWQNRNLG